MRLVDITNYSNACNKEIRHMLFDADNITDHIVVRHAGEGEETALLFK